MRVKVKLLLFIPLLTIADLFHLTYEWAAVGRRISPPAVACGDEGGSDIFRMNVKKVKSCIRGDCSRPVLYGNILINGEGFRTVSVPR